MAKSTCIKCGGTTFEMVEVKPYKSNFIVMFIQCSRCGGVVGVTDYYQIGTELQIIKKKLGIS